MMEYKKESQSVMLRYQYGHPGHIARFCNHNNKNKWGQLCNTWQNKATEGGCKGKNKTDKVKQASEINNYAGESATKNQILYWWTAVQLLTSSMMEPSSANLMTDSHQSTI